LARKAILKPLVSHIHPHYYHRKSPWQLESNQGLAKGSHDETHGNAMSYSRMSKDYKNFNMPTWKSQKPSKPVPTLRL
jgi:hypothetical protein